MSDDSFPYLSEFQDLEFPPIAGASPEGIVAVGGNLSPGMLLSAYRRGIFPWFSDDDPILWWSPDPRFILYPEKLRISKSMKKILKKGVFTVTIDEAFEEVIRHCRHIKRKKEAGTWITDDIIAGYGELHRLGYAHSVEVRQDGELVGGLYGISLGTAFFGESMFSLRPNTSKAALIYLSQNLEKKGFAFIDCQVYTEHLESMGAVEVPRDIFLEELETVLTRRTIKGSWTGLFNEVT